MKTGDGDLPRSESVGADAEERKGRTAAVDGTLARSEGNGMTLKVGPSLRCLDGDARSVVARGALCDEDAANGSEPTV